MLAKLAQTLGASLGSIKREFRDGYVKASGWSQLESIFASVMGGTSDNRKKSTQVQLREYQSWIYIILTTIYARTSTVPWKLQVQRAGNETEDLTNQWEHPLYKLLNNPNPFMTGTFLQQYVQMSLDLTGMAFVLKLRNGLRRPAELWPLNVAEFMDFIPGESTNDYIRGYQFTTASFPIEDVIYLYYPNPDASFFSSLGSQHSQNLFASLAGMSPVQAMGRSVDIEKYIEVYQRDFFENSARPDLILKPTGSKALDEKQRERLLSIWKQKHQGPAKFWEPTVINAAMEIEVLKGAHNKDFQFFKLAGWNKDMLTAAYSVPEGKLGLVKDINRANQIGVEITFNQECVLPRLDLWDEKFTNQLAHEFDEKLLVVHDNPVPSDKEFELKRDEFETKNYITTINEVRARDGKDPVEWGDAPWIPQNLFQPGDGGGGQVDDDIDETEEEPEKAACGCGCGGHHTAKQFLRDENAKIAYWKQFDARVRKHEKAFIVMVRKLFNAQRKEVLGNLESVAPQIEAQFAGWSARKVARYVAKNPKLINQILFDEKGAIKEFSKDANPIMAEAFADSGEAILADLGVDISFDVENTRARKFIGDKSKEFAKEVNDTTIKELRKTLKEGFGEGESVPKLAARIRKVYDKADRTRSIVMARTEIISSSNAGTLEGMKQSKVVKEKEWLSSRDDRVRDSHVSPLDGQVVKLNENFTTNDGNEGQYPGGFGIAAEDIQCRCSLIPVIE